MELERALTFAANHRNGLLTTLRRDGRPQQSVIFFQAAGDLQNLLLPHSVNEDIRF